MKQTKQILFIFFVICLLISNIICLGCAQQKIKKKSEKEDIPVGIPSKDEIPINIPTDVRYQIEKLYHPSPLDRAHAAIALGNMGKRATPAVPFLVGILCDYSRLMVWPSGSPTSTGRCAAVALGEIGDVRAVEPIIALLKNKGCQLNAKFALMLIGKPAVEPLITTLNDENADVRNYAAKALGEIGDARAVEPLIVLFKDEITYVRSSAATALGEIGDARAVEPLIVLLKDESTYVRSSAALALGEIGDARAFEPLIVLLKDESPDVRSFAALALGGIGDARAVEPLIAIFKDKGMKDLDLFIMLKNASAALGEIGDVRAVEPLIALLKDEDNLVRHYAGMTLSRITGQSFEKDHEKWQNWWNENKDKMLKKR